MIGGRGVESLAEALSFHKGVGGMLHTLVIDHNIVDNRGAEALAKMLSNKPMDQNNVDDRDAEAVAKAQPVFLQVVRALFGRVCRWARTGFLLETLNNILSNILSNILPECPLRIAENPSSFPHYFEAGESDSKCQNPWITCISLHPPGV
eukprot:8808477-Pyramimonas_sp.AAC.1